MELDDDLKQPSEAFCDTKITFHCPEFLSLNAATELLTRSLMNKKAIKGKSTV